VRNSFTALVVFGVTFLMVSCTNNLSNLNKSGKGTVDLWASVTKPQEASVLGKIAATTWDSLVVTITADDMDTIYYACKFSSTDPYVSVSLDNIPAGKSRNFAVYTKSKAGIVIHTCQNQVVDIAASEKRILDFKLAPVKGSIYIDLTNIPATVKRICTKFSIYSDSEDRSTKMYISLDNIPDKTSDSLIIEGKDSSGSLLYRSAVWFTFSATHDTSLSSGFYRITTGTSLTVTTQIPGVTVVSGNVDGTKKMAFETGKLLITEIMYNANDSEYIEIYNPSSSTYSDSLIIDLDGTCRSLGIISVLPKSFFVVGRKKFPWTDTSISTMDLSSTGNSLCLRSHAVSDTVMDWVAFTGGSNNQEWPNLGTAKKSIVCDSLVNDPAYNNFGHNWQPAQTAINQTYPTVSTGQIGTPKAAGF